MEEFYLFEGNSYLEKFSIKNWKCKRGVEFDNMLKELSNISINELIELLFRIRDYKSEQGLGSRIEFYKILKWFVKNNKTEILEHLKRIPDYGYWKDFLNLWSWGDELFRSYILYIYCKQLEKDWLDFQEGKTPSLAAKWAPTEKGSCDRMYGMVHIFCEQLNWSRKTYRQRISCLREKLEITERFFCKKQYGELDFDRIPLKCRKKNLNIINKHCSTRYSRWKNQKSKIL